MIMGEDRTDNHGTYDDDNHDDDNSVVLAI